MPPGLLYPLHGQPRRSRPFRHAALLGFSALCLAPLPVWAQGNETSDIEQPDPEYREQLLGTDENPYLSWPLSLPSLLYVCEINFEADVIEYDDNADIVSATGNLIIRSGDQSVRANAVSWIRTSG